jgi:hypothetical protein
MKLCERWCEVWTRLRGLAAAAKVPLDFTLVRCRGEVGELCHGLLEFLRAIEEWIRQCKVQVSVGDW